jgi:hypothetical protein
MTQTLKGRRVQSMDAIEQPGDYFGPHVGQTGDLPAVFFLKPNARDDGVSPRARSVQHVCSPPHTFRECPDGSLEIRPSISSFVRDVPHTPEFSDGWHGYLDAGHIWRKVGSI